MRNAFVLAGIAFAITLAVIVGTKLSDQALAVIAGAVCGIAASIPVSVGLVIAASKNWGHEEPYRETGYNYSARPAAPQQPIIVVAPPQMPMPYGMANQPYFFPSPTLDPAASPREFKVIGGD